MSARDVAAASAQANKVKADPMGAALLNSDSM